MYTMYRRNGMAGMKDRIVDSLEHGKERFSDMSHTVTDGSKDLARLTDRCVHQHAWKAIASMALFGVALGLLLRR